MMKRIMGALLALLLVPALSCAQELYSIAEIREQARTLGRWQQTYTDKYGREIAVDIAPIVPEVDAVQMELDHVDRKRSNSKEIEISVESYLCSNEVDEQKPYLGEGLPSVRACMDDAFARVGACYPEDELEFELIWLDVVLQSRPYYRCVLRQRVEGIPVLMGAQDPVHHIRQELGFERPSSWAYEESYRWGDFTRPFWELNAYADGGFMMMIYPLRVTGARADDVPLCGMDRVIESIEERIEAGYIRHVYALRLGYCCYPGEADEIVLCPVWMVECRYIYNPREGGAYTRKRDDVPYTNELNYHTMIVNAQTGAFMDPLALREKLLDCPDIITWEDAK